MLPMNNKAVSIFTGLALLAVLFVATSARVSAVEPSDSSPCSVVDQVYPPTEANQGFALVCNGEFWESCGFSPQRSPALCSQNPVCAPPSTLVNGVCTPPTANCPTGYTLVNGVCTPPTINCPTGYTLVSGVCTPPTSNCPTGYTLVNGVCKPPTINCPTGYTLVSGVCTPPSTNCPTGYTLVNGVCTPPTTNCPSGYVLVSGVCTPPTTNCVAPYTLVNGYCTPPTTTCYNGSVWQNGYCVPPPPPITYNYPVCSIYVSTTHVGRNQPAVLSWSSQYTSYGSITYVGSVATNGSVTVYPNQTTTYTGTFWGYNGQQVTCSATVYVDQYVVVPPVIYPQPPVVPYVTLATVPYTGLDLGPVGAVVYWGFLALVCLVLAYLIAVRRLQNDIARSLKTFLFGV